MPDFDEGLATLARHAERTGRLDTAAKVRQRADRRRRRRQATVVGLAAAGVLAISAAIALNGAAATPPLPPTESPPPRFVHPRLPTSLPILGLTQKESRLDDGRAYRLVPFSDLTQGGLAIGPDQRVVVSGQGARFTAATTTPGGREWIIRLDEAGGSWCLATRADGGLGVGACLTSDPSVRFTLVTAYDPEGRKMFDVVQRDRWLRWNRTTNRVFLAAMPWDSEVMTAWLFDDQGPAK
jgi:hypothetical protein